MIERRHGFGAAGKNSADVFDGNQRRHGAISAVSLA
jgi:hypothetical protein